MTTRLNDHRNRLFDDFYRNKELQRDFNTLKKSLGVDHLNFKAIYNASESDIAVAELFKYELGEKDQASLKTVLQNLKDGIRDWFHVNDYTNTYNFTLTVSERQKLLDEKKHELEEKQRLITEKYRQKME